MKINSYSKSHVNIHHRIATLCEPKSFSSPSKVSKTRRSASGLIDRDRLFQNGVNDSSVSCWQVFRKCQGAGGSALFPPEVIVFVKVFTCQIPKDLGLPSFKFTYSELAQQMKRQGLAVSPGRKAIWRWLSKNAIRPWCYRSWIWVRDPDFEQEAARVLGLYHELWAGEPSGEKAFIVSFDEKTSIQTRCRAKGTTAPQTGRYGRVEHKYEQMRALVYMTAWDVQRAQILGLCKPQTGIDSFHELVDLVMRQEPYRSADRVFWITDNCSSHRGRSSVTRLQNWYPNAMQVHTSIHANWLNQIEIYFPVLQRKVLTPNNFKNPFDLENRIADFQKSYEIIMKSFRWEFTREDMKKMFATFDDNQKMAA